MEFRKVLTLRGPNIWANFPVIEAWVDLGELKDRASDEIPGFNERLMAWLPTMIEHRCSIGERGGFFERLRRGTYMAHILEHVTLELQTLAGHEVAFGRARETAEEGVYKVIFKYREEHVARECLQTARQLCLAAVYDRPFDVAGAVEKLRDLSQRVSLGPSTRAIVEAARNRGIPTRRLNTDSLVQFGYGSRQRRIRAAETDRTGAIAQALAQDKELTRTLLKAVGVPVPDGRPVTDAEDAWTAAQEIGVPVVVKPQDGNQGRGVATNLSTREQVTAAYAAALLESDDVIVEKYAPGHDYRLLVVGDRVVAAARREPAHVVGDGVRTINQLIDIVNQDPRRGEHHATSLSKIHIDVVAAAVLKEQGFEPDSVPPAGQTVLIRRNANLSTGGTAIDVTERVHPEVAARAVDAARVIGLDIAGIDILAQDISRTMEEQGAIVVEVNAAPGLRMHLEPSAGVSRPVAEAIVDSLYAPNETGRIPVVAVTGVNGKTTVTRFIAHILKGTGRRVGMTCTDGIYINDRRIDNGDCSGPLSATNVLLNPAVDAAVLETARGGILRAGLAFDQCDVAVVTNIGDGDHLGLADIHTPEQLAKVKRCIVDVVAPQGTAVLNAADPLVAGMASYCPGHVLFFAIDGNHPVIVRHRSVGGKAIFVRAGDIVLADGDRESVLMAVDRVPLTFGGRIGFEVENTLAVLAAATCLGVPAEVIRTRAENFSADMDKVPGRFNLFEIRGATVIVDYGHNCHSLSAMIAALDTFPASRRTCVYTTAGDRRDCDIIRQGEMLAASFDRVILYEDHYMRGRAAGEIMGLMRQGLAAGKRVVQIDEVRGAVPAVEAALQSAQPGDLLLIQADTIDETVDFMRQYLQSLAAAAPKPEAAEPPVAVLPAVTAEAAGPVLAKPPVPAKAEAVV
jgi:cyanophycin synthetase